MELALFERSIVDTIQRRATLTISLVQKIGQSSLSGRLRGVCVLMGRMKARPGSGRRVVAQYDRSSTSIGAASPHQWWS